MFSFCDSTSSRVETELKSIERLIVGAEKKESCNSLVYDIQETLKW